MSNNIAKYRGTAGITQKALADALGWLPSRVANYEQGIREPKLEECRAIAQTLQSFGAKDATLDNVFPPKSSAA